MARALADDLGRFVFGGLEKKAGGGTEITQALASDDTRYMHRALEALGVRVRADEAARTFVVEGVDGRIPATEATLQIGNAGTAARFLTAAVALGRGTFVVDGSPAMRKRPIGPLVTANAASMP